MHFIYVICMYVYIYIIVMYVYVCVYTYLLLAHGTYSTLYLLKMAYTNVNLMPKFQEN